MLEDLIRITSTEPYRTRGGMRVKEISIHPWETPDAKCIFEIWTDDWEDDPQETWEVTCTNLKQTAGIPLAIVARTQMRLYNDHPLLWKRNVFFTITGGAKNIPEIIGELFIEHGKACGNWIDFNGCYGSLAETLKTLRENQLAIPSRLKDSCFDVLERHGVQFRVNSVENGEDHDQLLLFSSEEIWPDDENFKQSYLIGKDFSARRL